MEHETTIHAHPLNDGTAWFRVTCTCGWANRDPEHRIYSRWLAEDVGRRHRTAEPTTRSAGASR